MTDPQHCSEVSRIRAHISQLQPLAAMMGLELVSADRTRLLQAGSRIRFDPVSFFRKFNSIQQTFIGIFDKQATSQYIPYGFFMASILPQGVPYSFVDPLAPPC